MPLLKRAASCTTTLLKIVLGSFEDGVGPVYKIQSGDHVLQRHPVHTYRFPAKRSHATLTLNYLSFRGNWRSIRQGYKQNQKVSSACSLEAKPTGKESKEGEEKGGQSGATHLVEGLCVKVVWQLRKVWKDCAQVSVRR